MHFWLEMGILANFISDLINLKEHTRTFVIRMEGGIYEQPAPSVQLNVIFGIQPRSLSLS